MSGQLLIFIVPLGRILNKALISLTLGVLVRVGVLLGVYVLVGVGVGVMVGVLVVVGVGVIVGVLVGVYVGVLVGVAVGLVHANSATSDLNRYSYCPMWIVPKAVTVNFNL